MSSLLFSRTADPADLAWVIEAAELVGSHIKTIEDWKLLGARLRGVDDSLVALWWTLRPQTLLEADPRFSKSDPAYHWTRLLPSASKGGRFGLWKQALALGWDPRQKNPHAQAWSYLERLVCTNNRVAFLKDQWSQKNGFRVLQEMASWFLSQKMANEAFIAEGWSHLTLHPVEERARHDPTFVLIDTPLRTSGPIRKAKKTPPSSEAGPSAPPRVPQPDDGLPPFV